MIMVTTMLMKVVQAWCAARLAAAGAGWTARLSDEKLVSGLILFCIGPFEKVISDPT